MFSTKKGLPKESGQPKSQHQKVQRVAAASDLALSAVDDLRLPLGSGQEKVSFQVPSDTFGGALKGYCVRALATTWQLERYQNLRLAIGR